jgi:hypothetical protein
MKRIFFFATPADIAPVLQKLEANAPLKFVEMGTLKPRKFRTKELRHMKLAVSRRASWCRIEIP